MSLRELATNYVGKLVYDNIDSIDTISKSFMDNMNTKTEKIPTIIMNMYETPTHYHYELEITGVSKEHITLQQTEGYVKVSGERKRHTHISTDQYHKIESVYGKMERKFRLPENANPKNIEASFHNGLLLIKVSKIIENNQNTSTIQII